MRKQTPSNQPSSANPEGNIAVYEKVPSYKPQGHQS
jgi:hypothetical protein